MIQIQDLHLTLTSAAGPVHILRGVDLAVERGATVSVVGIAVMIHVQVVAPAGAALGPLARR